MASELKPCAHCGGAAELDYQQPFCAFPSGKMEKQVAIYCTECDVHMSMCYSDFPEYDHDQMAAILTEKWNTRPTPVAPVSPDASFIEAARWHEAEAERKRSVAVKSKRLEAQIATHEASAAHFRSAVPVSPDATGKCGELVTVGYTTAQGENYATGCYLLPGVKLYGMEAVVTRSQAEKLLAAEREKSLFFKTAMETAQTFCGLKDKTIANLEAKLAAEIRRERDLAEKQLSEVVDRMSDDYLALKAELDQAVGVIEDRSSEYEALEAKLAAAEADAIGYRSTIEHLTQRAETAEALVSKWKTAAGRNT